MNNVTLNSSKSRNIWERQESGVVTTHKLFYCKRTIGDGDVITPDS